MVYIIFLTSLILIIFSIFLKGIFAILCALISVILSIISLNKKIRLSLIVPIIGLIVIVFANLQFLGIITSFSKENMKQFTKSLNYSVNGYKLLKENNKIKAIIFFENAFEEAKKVDINNIEKIVKGFKQHFCNEYMKGLEIFIKGLKENNKEIMLEGAKLLDKWSLWHNRVIEKYTEKKSLFEFIKNYFK